MLVSRIYKISVMSTIDNNYLILCFIPVTEFHRNGSEGPGRARMKCSTTRFRIQTLSRFTTLENMNHTESAKVFRANRNMWKFVVLVANIRKSAGIVIYTLPCCSLWTVVSVATRTSACTIFT